MYIGCLLFVYIVCCICVGLFDYLIFDLLGLFICHWFSRFVVMINLNTVFVVYYVFVFYVEVWVVVVYIEVAWVVVCLFFVYCLLNFCLVLFDLTCCKRRVFVCEFDCVWGWYLDVCYGPVILDLADFRRYFGLALLWWFCGLRSLGLV